MIIDVTPSKPVYALILSVPQFSRFNNTEYWVLAVNAPDPVAEHSPVIVEERWILTVVAFCECTTPSMGAGSMHSSPLNVMNHRAQHSLWAKKHIIYWLLQDNSNIGGNKQIGRVKYLYLSYNLQHLWGTCWEFTPHSYEINTSTAH